MLRHAASEEEDDKARFVYYTLLNSFNRIQMDITFYANPMEFERLMRRPVPIMSLVVDVAEWTEAVGKALVGDDIIESGIYAGDSRLLRETAQLFPGTNKIYTSIGAGKIIYK